MASMAPAMDVPSPSVLEPKSPSQSKGLQTEGKQAKSTTSKKEKKVASATTAPNGDSNAAESAKEKGKDGKETKKSKDDMTIDDLLLPRTLISRLSRGSLPPNTSLQKDALLALTKSATVFISYLAHTANSLTSRKTIQADDILKAISEMELDSVMRERLEKEILLFEEGVRGKRKGYRDRVKARESGVSQLDETDLGENDGEHINKRVKRSTGGDDDTEMSGLGDSHLEGGSSGSVRRAGNGEGEDEDDDDDPSAQLLAEASRAAQDDDATESDEEDEDDEDGDDGAVENEDDDEDDEDDETRDLDGRRANGPILAPDGRAEVHGSDDESD